MDGKRKRCLAAAGAVLLILAAVLTAVLRPAAQPEAGELGVVLTACEKGALVVAVMQHSAAEQAGVTPGDVLVEYDGRALTEEDLGNSCFRPVGRDTSLVLERGGRRIHCTLGR